MNQNDDVFGDYRCVGDCYSTEQSVEIELDDETVSKIKDIFQKYDFDDYDSEEEEISKIIRSMINFVDEEEDIKTIFTSWGGCKMGIIFYCTHNIHLITNLLISKIIPKPHRL